MRDIIAMNGDETANQEGRKPKGIPISLHVDRGSKKAGRQERVKSVRDIVAKLSKFKWGD